MGESPERAIEGVPVAVVATVETDEFKSDDQYRQWDIIFYFLL